MGAGRRYEARYVWQAALTYAQGKAADRLRNSSATGRALKRMLGPVVSAATPDFAAVHMTWGAINELTTLTAYGRMMKTTQNPILAELDLA